MKFIRDIISEKKRDALMQSPDQLPEEDAAGGVPFTLAPDDAALGDDMLGDDMLGDDMAIEPADLPEPMEDAPAPADAATEMAEPEQEAAAFQDPLVLDEAHALPRDDSEAEADVASSDALLNMFSGSDVLEDEFEEEGDNAQSVFDDISSDFDDIADPFAIMPENQEPEHDGFMHEEADMDAPPSMPNAPDEIAEPDMVTTEATADHDMAPEQQEAIPAAQMSPPEPQAPQGAALMSSAGEWAGEPDAGAAQPMALPPQYRPVPGEFEAGGIPPMPRAMTPPPGMPSETPPMPKPVDVPAPASGRGSNRSGRVKTRLLGFNPSQSSVPDPFSAEADQRASDFTKFPVGWLAVVSGPGRGATFTIFAGVTHLGRGEDQGVRLNFGDNSISRSNHAAVAYDPENQKFYVGHGGKANLVRRNDMPVLSTEELESGDMIRVGETGLRFIALCGPEFSWEDRHDSDFRHASHG